MSEVGITITADDKAGAVLSAIGKTGKASLDNIRGAAGKAGEAFKMLGKATVVFNQALELSRKVMNGFRIVVVDSIRAALNFRKIGDPLIDAFKNMERNAQIFRARIGDVLLPLATGLMEAFSKVGDSVVDWININRKLIATNIANWMRDIANIAIKGVAFGILQVSRAWSGWLEIINLVKFGVNKFLKLMTEGIAVSIEALSGLVKLFDEDMGIALARTGDEALALAMHFGEMADENMAAVEGQIAKQDEFEKKLKEGVGGALEFVGEAHATMMRHIEASTIGGTRTIEEQIAAYEKLGETQKTIAANVETWGALQISVGKSMATNLQAYVTSEEGAHGKRRALMFSTMQTAITAASSEAAVKAIAAHTHIPFVGVAIGLSFAAAAVAAISKWANASFATGGMVEGPSGNDNLGIRVSRKERVLSRRQTESFEQLVGLLSGRGATAVAAGAGGGNFTYHQTNNSFMPPNDADFANATREQERIRRRLNRRGMLRK